MPDASALLITQQTYAISVLKAERMRLQEQHHCELCTRGWEYKAWQEKILSLTKAIAHLTPT